MDMGPSLMEEVLRELGYDAEQIAALRAIKALA